MLANAKVTTCLPVVDLNRAKDFYQNKLGLKFIETQIPYSLTFEAGNETQFFLYKREATKADHTAASFLVEVILTEVNALRAKGVQFETYDMGEIKTDENNIAHFGSTQSAWFKDSEGNILGIANH